jgi:predicted acylesterase/phospholipase RssA
MKTILSIDGGGIRGIIPALVLDAIEQQTGKAVSESFDLVAGTSTGGILALGFSKCKEKGKPYTAMELAGIYEEHGKKIFPRSPWKGVSSVFGLADEKYPHAGLEGVLEKYFGNAVLGECRTKTLVTSYDIENRAPRFFKSWKQEDKAILMRDVARATSAAPTYFEPALVSINGTERALIDGGVFINTPSVSAYVETKKIFPEESEFFVLSLGTGDLIRKIPYSEAINWGKIEWLSPLLSCMFGGMSDAANYQMDLLLSPGMHVRIQTRLETASDDMDNVSKGNIVNLKSEAADLIKNKKPVLQEVCAKLKLRG